MSRVSSFLAWKRTRSVIRQARVSLLGLARPCEKIDQRHRGVGGSDRVGLRGRARRWSRRARGNERRLARRRRSGTRHRRWSTRDGRRRRPGARRGRRSIPRPLQQVDERLRRVGVGGVLDRGRTAREHRQGDRGENNAQARGPRATPDRPFHANPLRLHARSSYLQRPAIGDLKILNSHRRRQIQKWCGTIITPREIRAGCAARCLPALRSLPFDSKRFPANARSRGRLKRKVAA